MGARSRPARRHASPPSGGSARDDLDDELRAWTMAYRQAGADLPFRNRARCLVRRSRGKLNWQGGPRDHAGGHVIPADPRAWVNYVRGTPTVQRDKLDKLPENEPLAIGDLVLRLELDQEDQPHPGPASVLPELPSRRRQRDSVGRRRKHVPGDRSHPHGVSARDTRRFSPLRRIRTHSASPGTLPSVASTPF